MQLKWMGQGQERQKGKGRPRLQWGRGMDLENGPESKWPRSFTIHQGHRGGSSVELESFAGYCLQEDVLED